MDLETGHGETKGPGLLKDSVDDWKLAFLTQEVGPIQSNIKKAAT